MEEGCGDTGMGRVVSDSSGQSITCSECGKDLNHWHRHAPHLQPCPFCGIFKPDNLSSSTANNEAD